MPKKIFTHSFEDISEDGTLSIETDALKDQKITFGIDEDEIWVSANKEGWLHLARICAELALGNYEPGYHFHKNCNFKEGNEKPTVSFGIPD